MTAINVYSKEQVDAQLADKQGTLTAGANITISADNVISSTGGGGGGSYVAGEGISISGQTISNAAIPDVDKAYVDAQLATKPDSGDVYTKTQADTLLALKADKSTTYTKTEVDTALALKANQATTYTKTEVDNLLPNADELVPDYSGASAGDVLTIESGAPVWKTAGSGGSFRWFTSPTDFQTWVNTESKKGDVVLSCTIEYSSGVLTYVSISGWMVKSHSANSGLAVGSYWPTSSTAQLIKEIVTSNTSRLAITANSTVNINYADMTSLLALVYIG